MGIARRWVGGRARGQSAAEYAIVFSVVVAALIGMQIYVKRGLNARLRDGSDNASTLVAAKLGVAGGQDQRDIQQYEPYYADSDYKVSQFADREDKVNPGGVVSRAVTKDQTTRTGKQTVKGVQ